MKLITTTLLACLLLPFNAVSKCNTPIRIAIIDTGFGWQGLGDTSHLCKYGHKDFTDDQEFLPDSGTVNPVPVDSHGHGTNIAGVIEQQLVGVNYCLVIIKYYTPTNSGEDSLINSIKAIEYVTALGLEFINYSGGGEGHYDAEEDAVKAYLDNGGIFVAAAGNGSVDLSYHPYYPAMDDSRVVVVGAKDQSGQRLKFSNYGSRINVWELGDKVRGNDLVMSGTSQATAIATGKFARVYDKYCKTNPEVSANLLRSVASTEENSCH